MIRLAPLVLLAACSAGPWMPPDDEIAAPLPVLVKPYYGDLPGVMAWAQRLGAHCEIHVPLGPLRACYTVAEAVECERMVDPNNESGAGLKTSAAESSRWSRRCGDKADWSEELQRLGVR